MTDEIYTELKAIKAQQNRIECNQGKILATLATLCPEHSTADAAMAAANKVFSRLEKEEA